MKTSILTGLLDQLELGRPEGHRNLELVPLRSRVDDGPDYISLGEALQNGSVTVTEVGEAGSVPNLKVRNLGMVAVLMLDGEELSGAKQNRVLNTTILLRAGSDLIVPVSCTEQGRWAYQSAEFSSSGHIMASEIRRRKSRSVSNSLREEASFASDQGEVWESIASLHASAGTTSNTGAMADAFEARIDDLNGFEEAFRAGDGQKGFVVFIDGRPAGVELVSRAEAYRKLHPQLVRSYAMDALVSNRSETPGAGGGDVVERASAFVASLRNCSETPFASVGMGSDYRYEGAGVVGSALYSDGAVVHAAFFADRGGEGEGDLPKRRPMSGMRQRRGFRRRGDDVD